jgi:hypothetical protein
MALRAGGSDLYGPFGFVGPTRTLVPHLAVAALAAGRTDAEDVPAVRRAVVEANNSSTPALRLKARLESEPDPLPELLICDTSMGLIVND